jgi:UDP-2,4-diacetamido-2,4,6-trideoxy-beta-L-altropyranose hydrolase
MKSAPFAVFRCDASPAIGAGHVMRCLGLAEALVDAGWRVVFAVSQETPATVPALFRAGCETIVLAANQDDAVALGDALGSVDLLVIDHYGLDKDFEHNCRVWTRQIMVYDDATARNHDCDLLLDAAVTDPAVYRCHVPSQARLLLGPAYATLRRSFLAKRSEALSRRDRRQVGHILVSLGATDPKNITCGVLDALLPLPDGVTVSVILSSAAMHLDQVRQRVTGPVRLLTDVADMAALMAEADIAIGAAGASAYERTVLGLPAVVVMAADNQRGICDLLTNAEAAIALSCVGSDFGPRLGELVATLIEDAETRLRMARAAAALTDGAGATRVMRMLKC